MKVMVSGTLRWKTEKLWHPLLLKSFPDGSHLHSPAVGMQSRQKAGRMLHILAKTHMKYFRMRLCSTDPPTQTLLNLRLPKMLENTKHVSSVLLVFCILCDDSRGNARLIVVIVHIHITPCISSSQEYCTFDLLLCVGASVLALCAAHWLF